jgi:hypothetical protein
MFSSRSVEMGKVFGNARFNNGREAHVLQHHKAMTAMVLEFLRRS